MHPHTKQQLDDLIKILEMPADVLYQEELNNLRSLKEEKRTLVISASINPEYYRKTKIIGLFQQALLSQAEYIRDEMVPDIKPFIKGIAYTYDNNVNSGFNNCRQEVIKSLDNLINSFK